MTLDAASLIVTLRGRCNLAVCHACREQVIDLYALGPVWDTAVPIDDLVLVFKNEVIELVQYLLVSILDFSRRLELGFLDVFDDSGRDILTLVCLTQIDLPQLEADQMLFPRHLSIFQHEASGHRPRHLP